MNIQPIDYQKLGPQHPKVISFLKKRFDQKRDFSSFQTLHIGDDLTKYGQQREELLIPYPPNKVWNCYTGDHPAENWAGPMVNFIFAYSPSSKEIIYPNSPFEAAMTPGMQFYCWLNILGPRLVIGLKLLNLDPEKREMEIAYIEGGLYKGTQRLEFREAPNHATRLIHHSYFKSDSWFRDAFLYPFFHRMTVGEFHRRRLQKLKNS